MTKLFCRLNLKGILVFYVEEIQPTAGVKSCVKGAVGHSGERFPNVNDIEKASISHKCVTG